MIAKERTIPIRIQILEALLGRLPKNHPKRPPISQELSRRQAGYNGEESLDLHLNSLPEKNYTIFHDLNLPDGDYNCQIDTLLLSPGLILSIEVKNMAGKLIFDLENEQFIQKVDENEKGYPDPVSQAQRHQNYLRKLLEDHHFPPVPIDYLIVITNRYAILEFYGKNPSIKQRVCKDHSFLKRVQLLEKTHPKEILSPKELRKLTRLFVKKNTPPTSRILQKYGIQKADLLTGIQCPSCSYLPLTRQKRKWYCPSCRSFSKDAHVDALRDYFLLFDSKISNQQFQEFAHLSSRDVASRLLISMNLSYSGTKKDRVYYSTILD